MMELDKIYNMDCLEGMRMIPDKSIDLVVTDPPYLLNLDYGGGAFGKKKRRYHNEIGSISNGIVDEVLNEMLRVCKKPNIYSFCSKDQLPQLLDFARDNGLFFDVLTWHKTNPVPTCYGKYLSDTEYIVYLRKGAKLYGSYATKRKYFITPVNAADKKKYGHPTVKPLNIVQTLVENSTKEGDIVLDPFIGSGTTAVAVYRGGRHFIGFEINEEYYATAVRRLDEERRNPRLL